MKKWIYRLLLTELCILWLAFTLTYFAAIYDIENDFETTLKFVHVLMYGSVTIMLVFRVLLDGAFPEKAKD